MVENLLSFDFAAAVAVFASITFGFSALNYRGIERRAFDIRWYGGLVMLALGALLGTLDNPAHTQASILTYLAAPFAGYILLKAKKLAPAR